MIKLRGGISKLLRWLMIIAVSIAVVIGVIFLMLLAFFVFVVSPELGGLGITPNKRTALAKYSEITSQVGDICPEVPKLSAVREASCKAGYDGVFCPEEDAVLCQPIDKGILHVALPVFEIHDREQGLRLLTFHWLNCLWWDCVDGPHVIQQTADYFARNGVYDKWYHFISCSELIKAVLAKDGDPEAFELKLKAFADQFGYNNLPKEYKHDEKWFLGADSDAFDGYSYYWVDELYKFETDECRLTDELAVKLGAIE